MEKNDKMVDENIVGLESNRTDTATPPVFTCWSPSDYLFPLPKSPQKQTFIAKVTLTWPFNNSSLAGAVNFEFLSSASWSSSNGKNSAQIASQKDQDTMSET